MEKVKLPHSSQWQTSPTRIVFFICGVLSTGWLAGYLLAQEIATTERVGPMALVYSLGAVLAVTVFAFLASAPGQRGALFKQILPKGGSDAVLTAVLTPLAVAAIGGWAALYTAPEGGVFHFDKALQAFIGLLPIAIIWGFLEEIGWRGYLVRVLAFRWGGLTASLAVGVLWGLWHVPQMFLGDLPFGGAFVERPWLGSGLWVLTTTAYGVVFGWLTLRTGSIFWAALSHAIFNMAGTGVLAGIEGTPNLVYGSTGGLIAGLLGLTLGVTLFILMRAPKITPGASSTPAPS